MQKTHKTDTIVRTISVSSPRERCWQALTEAEHVARWFGDSAEIDLRPGGRIAFGWSEFEAVTEGTVRIVDEPSEFSYSWEAGEDDKGVMWTTTVTFTLREQDGNTIIEMVETGFSDLPDEIYSRTLEGNTSGWEAEMGDLGTYLDGAFE